MHQLTVGFGLWDRNQNDMESGVWERESTMEFPKNTTDLSVRFEVKWAVVNM